MAYSATTGRTEREDDASCRGVSVDSVHATFRNLRIGPSLLQTLARDAEELERMRGENQ